MSDERKTQLAKQVYKDLCGAIEKRNWKYNRNDDDLIVDFTVTGEDIPMNFILLIDVDRQLIRLVSPLPFKMSESKIMEGAIATCAATYRMIDGSFDYDLSDGEIDFRLTASFIDSVIGDGLFQYMISLSCVMVDKYNDKFLALDKGLIGISEFIEKAE